MTLSQTNVLLSFLNTEADGLSSVELQKLVFLYSKIIEKKPSYEFVPFQKGCYSFTLAHDMESLVSKEYVEQTRDLSTHEHRFFLTDYGRFQIADARTTSLYISHFRKANPWHGNDLIAFTYRRFPYWATRSRILDQILGDSPPTREAIAQARPKSSVRLASIGYEGRSVENYFNALIQNRIDILYDVRRNPISRKFGFSKLALQRICSGLGITYIHLPILGIDGSERTALNTQADYDALFARYEKMTLPRQDVISVIGAMADTVRKGKHVALTCFEANPLQCHRTRVIRKLEELLSINHSDL